MLCHIQASRLCALLTAFYIFQLYFRGQKGILAAQGQYSMSHKNTVLMHFVILEQLMMWNISVQGHAEYSSNLLYLPKVNLCFVQNKHMLSPSLLGCTAGVSTLQPMGHIWPPTSFFLTCSKFCVCITYFHGAGGLATSTITTHEAERSEPMGEIY